jgi:cardiolipin synthase
MDSSLVAALSGAFFVTVIAAVILRILLRPNREPAARVAWVVIVLALPLAGILAYLVLGEVRIGRGHLVRARTVRSALPDPAELVESERQPPPNIPDRYTTLFQLGCSISGYVPAGGNRGELAADSQQAMRWIEADIDAARETVHVLFYIWLEDDTGRRIADAIARAAERGVTCRVLVDALGSRQFINSRSWGTMRKAGAKLRVAMPIGSLLLRPLRSRIDIRNHRKIVVIDSEVTYCGSQNCADAEFRIKRRYAPWVDVMLRLRGPVVMQNQHLFAADWMCERGDDISALLNAGTWANADAGAVAQVVATGPTFRNSAMPELFVALIYSARRELIITTPYYVPSETLQDALCASAYRGVETSLVLPARNDSRFVAAASRSSYADLLAAGVKVYEYPGGLLHAKTLTVDGEVCLLGSANLDRRSFDLNYENNLLIYDAGITAVLRKRQRFYARSAVKISEERIRGWSPLRRLWNNLCAILSPVL